MVTKLSVLSFVLLLAVDGIAQQNSSLIPPPLPRTPPGPLPPAVEYMTFGAATAALQARQGAPQIRVDERTLPNQRPPERNAVYVIKKNGDRSEERGENQTYLFEEAQSGQLVLVSAAESWTTLLPNASVHASYTAYDIKTSDAWNVRVLWGTVRVASLASTPNLQALCEDDAKLAEITRRIERGRDTDSGKVSGIHMGNVSCAKQKAL